MNNSLASESKWRDAERIYEEALALGAGRIVFTAAGEYFFSDPNVQRAFDVIQECKAERYKLQKLQEGRWINITKYKTLGFGQLAFEALQSGDLKTARSVPTVDVARAATLNPRLFHYSLKIVMKELTTGRDAWRDSWRINTLRGLFDKLAETYDDERLEYARAGVDLFSSIAQLRFDTKPDDLKAAQVVRDIQAKVQADPKRYSSREAEIAVLLSLGKVSSLNDRPKAAEYFTKARELDVSGLIEYFYSDMGAMTYFSEEHLAPDSLERANSIRESVTSIRETHTKNSVGTLISVDKHFFRIYAPIIFYYAQQLPDVDYNILICGSEQESQELISAADQYLGSLAAINRSGVPANVSFYRVPVPDFVAEEKTFFASARFFATQFMLERHPNVYAMDADLLSDLDPRPFFAKVKDVAFGAPETADFNYLSPWRRNMAGNLALNRSVLDTPILEDLQIYLANGLSNPASWMLDQNGMAYTIERNHSNYTNLAPYHRPFRQPKFRSSWEKNYWSHLKEQED